MKGMKKIALSLIAVFALVLMIQVPTKAAGTVTMKGISDNSVTISWEKPSLGSSYTLTGYSIYDTSTATYLMTDISPNQTSVTIPITGKGYVSRWRVDYSYLFYGKSYTYTGYGYSYVNTTPVTYSTKNFAIDYLYFSLKKVDFVVGKAEGSTGTELEIYQVSNGKKKATMTATGSYFGTFKFASNTAYKYRVRSYYTNDTTQQTYKGGWSSYRYFATPSFGGTYKYAKNGINITLKKGSGITHYKIQISTKKNSGFKTVKTIKVGSKSKYSYKIKKCSGKALKKGKTYYIRIVPTIKGNKKSDIYGSASVTFYR